MNDSPSNNSNNKVNLFLDSVCVYIKCKSVHKDVRDELVGHIADLKEWYIQEGQSEETALDMAISAMGSSEKIGKRLNKQHRPQTEWSLIGLTAVIAAIGGIVMYLSSQYEFNQAVDFGQYLLYAVIGIAAMVGLYFFDYTKLKKLSWPIYLFSMAIIIVTIISGARINGLARYIMIGGLNISTAFTSLLFMVSFAGFVEKSRGRGTRSIIKLFVIAAISILPILMQPNLTQALILAFGYLVLVIFAVIRKHLGGSRTRQFIVMGVVLGLSCLLFVGNIFSAGYRSARWHVFIDGIAARITGSPLPTRPERSILSTGYGQ